MPPPSNQRGENEPPEEITMIAAQGFMTGAFRVCRTANLNKLS
jgi:hypothetical protein